MESTEALTPAFALFIALAMPVRVSVEATEMVVPFITMSPEMPRAVLDDVKLSEAICSGRREVRHLYRVSAGGDSAASRWMR